MSCFTRKIAFAKLVTTVEDNDGCIVDEIVKLLSNLFILLIKL